MIVVDRLFDTRCADSRKWPYDQACHLFSTLPGDAGRTELVAFGKRIGMQERWIQPGKLMGIMCYHYDLTPGKRLLAVSKGATQIDGGDYLGMLQAEAEKATC